jgi:hypothetical protein
VPGRWRSIQQGVELFRGEDGGGAVAIDLHGAAINCSNPSCSSIRTATP